MNCARPPDVVACEGANVPESAVIVTLVPSDTLAPVASLAATVTNDTDWAPVHCNVVGLGVIVRVVAVLPNDGVHVPVAGLKTPPVGQTPAPPEVQLNVAVRPARAKFAVPGALQLNVAETP